MTNSERNQAIRTLIRDYTTRNTANRETARTALIKEGIYTSKGNLKAQFGGRGGGKK